MNKVLKAAPIIMLALAVLLVACQQFSPATTKPTASNRSSIEGTEVGNLAPDFRLPDLGGQLVSLSDFRGKPVLINFWATWCPACRVEMPYLEQIYQEWSGRGLVLLAVDIGESQAIVKDFMQQYGLSFPALLDTTQTVARRYTIRAIPTSFIVDREGVIQVKKIGAFRDKEEIEGYLSKVFP